MKTSRCLINIFNHLFDETVRVLRVQNSNDSLIMRIFPIEEKYNFFFFLILYSFLFSCALSHRTSDRLCSPKHCNRWRIRDFRVLLIRICGTLRIKGRNRRIDVMPAEIPYRAFKSKREHSTAIYALM